MKFTAKKKKKILPGIKGSFHNDRGVNESEEFNSNVYACDYNRASKYMSKTCSTTFENRQIQIIVTFYVAKLKKRHCCFVDAWTPELNWISKPSFLFGGSCGEWGGWRASNQNLMKFLMIK